MFCDERSELGKQSEKGFRVSNFMVTSTLDGGEWSTSCYGHFSHEKKKKHPMNGRLGRPQNWSEHSGEEKNLLPMPEIESQIVQPTAYSPY